MNRSLKEGWRLAPRFQSGAGAFNREIEARCRLERRAASVA